MPTFRCNYCSINWPQSQTYGKCPKCERATCRFPTLKSIDEEEARSLRLHAEFDKYYEKWDQEHPPDRLLPDEKDECSLV